MALLSALRQIAGICAGPLSDALETERYTLVLGTFSLPINIPRTNYNKGLQARKKLVAMVTDRRSSGCNDDILDALLSGNEGTREKLSDERIIDLLITLIYSGYETVSMTMMRAVKYLSDDQKALEQIRKEQVDIRKGKAPEDALDWNDYKSMTFTRATSEINYDPFLYPESQTHGFQPLEMADDARMCPGKEVAL
ncbi:hypothetical protein EJB05_01447, partial [Eragrostis curvula]